MILLAAVHPWPAEVTCATRQCQKWAGEEIIIQPLREQVVLTARCCHPPLWVSSLTNSRLTTHTAFCLGALHLSQLLLSMLKHIADTFMLWCRWVGALGQPLLALLTRKILHECYFSLRTAVLSLQVRHTAQTQLPLMRGERCCPLFR